MMSLDPQAVTLPILRALWAGGHAHLSDEALGRIDASAAAVARIVASGETVYGINTGFGLLAQELIPHDRLAELQRNLILSHSCGLGQAIMWD
jgi:histidine ammonia-lyase